MRQGAGFKYKGTLNTVKLKQPKYNWQNYKFGSISLCMIMRNSSKTLRRCLNSVRGLVNEIVIVDTGSEDDSIKIAEEFGARVYRDPWQDDFSRPRNIGLEEAQCQWILIMDPDETVSVENHIDIKWLTRIKHYVAFFLTTRNYGPVVRDPRYQPLREGKDPSGKFPGYTPSNKTRLFKNNLGIKFEGCWHELVAWGILRRKMLIAQSTVPIHHWSHEFEQKTWAEKRAFYLKMGEKKVREWPKSGKSWWELSVSEAAVHLHKRAAYSTAQAIRYGFKGKEQYFSLSRYQNFVGRRKNANFAFEKGLCELYPSLTHIDARNKSLDGLISGVDNKPEDIFGKG